MLKRENGAIFLGYHSFCMKSKKFVCVANVLLLQIWQIRYYSLSSQVNKDKCDKCFLENQFRIAVEPII